ALNRARLGSVVFADEAKRQLLNSILHPLIITAQDEWMRARAGEDSRGVAVVDAALMIETGSYRRFDKLIVVHCDEAAQLARLMKRDNLAREEALRRIAAQMPQREKMRHADYLVDTSGTYDETRAQVVGLNEQLRRLARDPAAAGGFARG
ncbi:MAG: dephospho-CoA kinase, partial [Acidobacteria bacterium]|nr:dephospho-CoA kinase [Acidobacteriota bacterium]